MLTLSYHLLLKGIVSWRSYGEGLQSSLNITIINKTLIIANKEVTLIISSQDCLVRSDLPDISFRFYQNTCFQYCCNKIATRSIISCPNIRKEQASSCNIQICEKRKKLNPVAVLVASWLLKRWWVCHIWKCHVYIYGWLVIPVSALLQENWPKNHCTSFFFINSTKHASQTISCLSPKCMYFSQNIALEEQLNIFYLYKTLLLTYSSM